MAIVFSSAETENQALVDRINAFIGRTFFKAGKYSVSKAVLPFYADRTEIVKVMNFATLPNMTRTFLCSAEKVFETDGTSESVEEANVCFRLNLTTENVADYAAFFFDRLHTPDGKFKLIRSIDDVPFSSNIDDDLADALKQLITPPAVETTENGFSVSANILYAAVLFKAVILVSAGGETTVAHEEPVFEDLPVEKQKLR